MLRPWNFEIQLDVKSGKAIYMQIADVIISQIQSGRLQSGDVLPGSRHLAELLKVNRNTIVEALNVLINEEWVLSKERKGIFVSDKLPALVKLKQRPTGMLHNTDTKATNYRVSFDDGYPDSKVAPIDELARAYRQIFSRKGRWQMMGYGDELGDVAFRKAIVHMLNHQRGLQVNEQHICITRGSQMAMYLTAQCLFDSGGYVMIETPGYKPAWQAFEKAGAKLLPVRVDAEGLIIEDVEKHLKTNKKIVALYTTPHRQYPTTVTLSLERRLKLVSLANKYQFSIIEDDYDHEFHFGYRPLLPLASFADLKNYIYIGTMSKVVAPALRIGYLVSNDDALVKKAGSIRKLIDVQGDTIMEQAVLELIKDGTIRRHIKRSTQYYKHKRDFTASLLQSRLAGKIDFKIPDGGLAFWIVPHKKIQWKQLCEKLAKKGIKIIVPEHYSYGTPVNGIRLSYGSLSESQLAEGITALGELL